MIYEPLLDVLNSGRAWAFVGSGASADAGYPGWGSLVDDVLRGLDSDRAQIEDDARFVKARERQDYPAAFGRIESHVGRDRLIASVRGSLSADVKPGPVTKLVADIPFAGYITSNYDPLIEKALRTVGATGWVPVGNAESELAKVSGDVDRIVWHVHGLTDPNPASDLILTEDDYEAVYAEGSPLLTQMRGLLANRRLVFVGFGMGDVEVMRMLRSIGRLSNPARPAFAILPSTVADEATRQELRERHNVDVIPYPISHGPNPHAALRPLLETYGALTVRRSITYNGRGGVGERHDPATTGLLLYNKLCLDEAGLVSESVASGLTRSLCMALLKDGPQSIVELTNKIDARAQLLTQNRGEPDWTPRLLADALKELESDDKVTVSADGKGGFLVALTSEGAALLSEHASAAGLMEAQFLASLRDRLHPYLEEHSEDSLDRIASVAADFLVESVEKRALGVALALGASKPDMRALQVSALLRELPTYAARLASTQEAHVLVELIRRVFTDLGTEEAKFLGLSLQAKFGVHLLGLDPTTVDTRLSRIRETVFVIDATTLIPLLARSSPGHAAASLALQKMKAVGAVAVTSTLLAEEVAEHARWAVDRVGPTGAMDNVQAYAAYVGQGGKKENAFLQGLVREVTDGLRGNDFSDYMVSTLGPQAEGRRYEVEHVCAALKALDVECYDFDEWDGFDQTLWGDLEEAINHIEKVRRAQHSYRHDRQVRAEAEAAVVVSALRDDRLKGCRGLPLNEAYFVSQTRAVEAAVGGTHALTMKMDGVVQWLSTLQPLSADDLPHLGRALLGELSMTGQSFLDVHRLVGAFGPYMVACAEKLHEEVERSSGLIAERYGIDGVGDLKRVEPYDAPMVLQSLLVQLQEDLVRQVDSGRRALNALSGKATLTQKERDELERLRADKRQRASKAAAKKRSAQSRPKKGKAKKKKKK